MKRLSKLYALLAACTMFGGSRALTAAEIAWESEYRETGSKLYDSTGQTLGSSIYFEIGSFQTGFTPTALNMDQWAANWKMFDKTYDGDTNGLWDAAHGQFGGGAQFDPSGYSLSPDASPSTIFSADEQLYIWAYNSKDYIEGSEWALVTRTQPSGTPAFNDWITPDPAGSFTAQVKLQEADTVVFGGLNDVQGPGTYDTGAAPASFDLQLHAVPEPSSMMLALLGLLGFVRRRR